MTLADVATALRRFWLLAFLVLAVVVGLGLLGALLPEPRYQSTAVLNVVPADEETFSFGAAQTVEFLVPPVLARIESTAFEQGVRERLPAPLSNVPFSISAANDPGTGIIEIEVESTNPSTALRAAQIAAQRLAEFPRSDLIGITILNPPTPADGLTAERRVPIIAGSAVLGLILAILSAVAAHRLRPQIPRAQEFRERYGHTVLGEIPRRRKMRTQSAAVFNAEGPPDVVEAFRSLQTVFVMRQRRLVRDTQAKDVVAVTSWSGGEGKTTVTANLAWALAASGRDVAVVDCDLRRPRVHDLLGVSAERGVADVARGASVASVVQETALDTLVVVSAGLSDGHATDMVHNALPHVLTVLSDRLVLIDTPPMFAAETTEIADAAGGLVLVADVRERKAHEIGEALADLGLTGTPVLGVVLNRVQATNQRGELTYYYAPSESRKPAARGG